MRNIASNGLSSVRNALRLMAISAALLCLAGCVKPEIKTFAPQRGEVCDTVTLKGDMLYGQFKGVWFNGVQADAHMGPPLGQFTPSDTITATVPLGATSGPIRVVFDAGWAFILGVESADLHLTPDFMVTGTPPKPTIGQLVAAPVTIAPGQSVTVSWTTSGPLTALTLDGASVLGSTSKTVSLTQPGVHTFTLVASNHCRSSTATFNVTVLAPLKLTLNPTSVTIAPGATTTTTMTIGGDLNAVDVTCPAAAGLGCTPVHFSPSNMSQSQPMTISAAGNATFGAHSLTLTAKEAAPGTASSSAPLSVAVNRKSGAFVEVTPTANQPGSSITSPDHSVTAMISVGTSGSNSRNVAFGTSTKHFGATFSIGGLSALPATGGVGFTADSTQAVVASATDPASTAQQIDFSAFPVATYQASAIPPSMLAYEKDPVNGGATDLVQPRIFFSPDSSLALVISAPDAAASGSGLDIGYVFYDLSNGQTAVRIPGGSGNATGFVSASVVGNYIEVTFTNSPTPMKILIQ